MAGRTPFGKLRLTAARRAITRALCSMQGAFTVDDLIAAVRHSDSVASTATVYRAVTTLESSRELERVGSRDGAALYVRCAHRSHHHHHIVCDSCGKTEEAECPVASLETTSTPSGFVVTRHEVTLYGLCPECARTGDH